MQKEILSRICERKLEEEHAGWYKNILCVT